MLESRGHSSGYLSVVKHIIDAVQLKPEEVVLEVGVARECWIAGSQSIRRGPILLLV